MPEQKYILYAVYSGELANLKGYLDANVSVTGVNIFLAETPKCLFSSEEVSIILAEAEDVTRHPPSVITVLPVTIGAPLTLQESADMRNSVAPGDFKNRAEMFRKICWR